MTIKKIICYICATMIACSLLVGGVSAEKSSYVKNEGPIFLVTNDAGVWPLGVDFYYGYTEIYTPTSSSIKYTNHQSYAYAKNWSSLIATLKVINSHTANYYDSSNTFIKSATMSPDKDSMIDPSWYGYESATGTSVATINTNPSYAKANFSLYCPEALAVSFNDSISLRCS
ncbi:hypothetical protein [Intestinibacillus massiliensis]|uniref:hypothetical protein n=1 Tax=Intestinibacillus massiliensis TaxID=1871029 RepID=UPI00117A5A48|nr:hypothetical protein [Intestinibacillus massiliensis]